MTISQEPTGWKKSSYSENESCVELDSTRTWVRDSKHPSSRIRFGQHALGVFIEAMKAST
jgi:hypothetical protein